MSLATSPSAVESRTSAVPVAGRSVEAPLSVLPQLKRAFGIEFSLWDGTTGDLLHRSNTYPHGDEHLVAELVRSAARQSGAQLLAEEECALLLALPLRGLRRRAYVAVGAFVTRHPETAEQVQAAARLLGMTRRAAGEWLHRQSVWSHDALMRLGDVVLEKLAVQAQADRLEREVDKLAQNLALSYEEVSLLCGLTHNLRISKSEEELGKLALDWLSECMPVQGLTILYLPNRFDADGIYDAAEKSRQLSVGKHTIEAAEFQRLLDALQLSSGCGPCVANRATTADESWPMPELQQVVVAPISDGEKTFGWLAALNHASGEEFSTVEASLMASVGALLGIHCGNHDLYRQQADLLAGVVRALTSAIDAKDPYTCGHSDRVARISVRLAEELGLSGDILQTLYMAGLLHDIGKIGIDDSVLRKAGCLTPAEFEHIKMHPELGHRILADLKQLADVLPVVLHHHEQWDGSGYPHQLAGDAIPLSARIVAVADAFDAMIGDRPYRKGIPVEMVEDIFRSGAGKQWDASVVDAYFRAREDIHQLYQREECIAPADLVQWS